MEEKDILQYGVWEKDNKRFRPCVGGKTDAQSLHAVGIAAGMNVELAVVVLLERE
jgi:hypothetical protein